MYRLGDTSTTEPSEKVYRFIDKFSEVFSKSGYVTKPEISELREQLEIISECANKTEQKLIDNIYDAFARYPLKADDKKIIIDAKKELIKIGKRYEEEYEEEENDDDITEDLDTDEIEQKLDEKVHKYNKYSETHPMEGITWNTSKNKYTIIYDTINTTAGKLSTAVDKILTYFDQENPEKNLKKLAKQNFTYRNHYFMIYWYENEPYFDIQHIISVLNLKPSYIREKYNDYADEIEYYIWHKNEYGGYILRELIDEKTMYNMMLSSNSTISKSFKGDIAKILTKLRKQNKLIITNDSIQLKEGVTKPNIKSFYDITQITSYYGKAVIYIAFIGKVKGEYMFKYGLSRKMFERDYKQHSKFFDDFKVMYIGETDNCEYIETVLENDLKMFALHRVCKINDKNQTELFAITEQHTIESIIEHTKMLIEKYKLPAIMEAQTKIGALNSTIALYQQSDRIRELELRYKMSENYKLEIKRDIEIKKYDVELRKLDLKLEREKNQRKQTESDLTASDQSESESDSDIESSIIHNKENSIYKQYLAERTEKADTHIHTSILYNDFKRWFSSNNPTSRIPSNKMFVAGLRNTITIENVKIDGKSTTGTKNRKIRCDDLDIVEV